MGQAMDTTVIHTPSATHRPIPAVTATALIRGVAIQPLIVAGIRRPITVIATVALFDRRSPIMAAPIRAVSIIATAGEVARVAGLGARRLAPSRRWWPVLLRVMATWLEPWPWAHVLSWHRMRDCHTSQKPR
jgi:hypothetical protein